LSELKIGIIFAYNQKEMFSKACEYAIKATTYIAQQSLQNRRVSLKEITKEIDSPLAFTAKILHQLAKNNILDSTKGPSGGFQISKERVEVISLSDVVFAIDGDSIYVGCGIGLDKCNANSPCPVHDKFSIIREELKQMLKKTSLLSLATSVESGLTYLKR
jgi:Rrf2 family protein